MHIGSLTNAFQSAPNRNVFLFAIQIFYKHVAKPASRQYTFVYIENEFGRVCFIWQQELQ